MSKRPGAASVILVGETGSGKTAQFLTLPGRKFVQAFDPGCDDTLQGEVPIEWWLARGDLEMASKSVIKSGKVKRDAATTTAGPQVFNTWAADFNHKLETGFFDDIDAFMLDSATVLGWHALQRVRYLQEAIDRDDERTDYRIAGELVTNALFSVLSLPCTVVVTVHTKSQEDKATGTRNKAFSLPGGATIYTPRGAGIIWGTEVVPQEKGKPPRYALITQASRQHPLCKNSRRFAGLPERIDATIEDFSRASDFGIGALMQGLPPVVFSSARERRD